MVATTTFQGGGYPGRPYGSFAGKSPSAGNGPHDPGRITELWGWGGPGGRHTFVAKAPVTPTPPPPPAVRDPGAGGGHKPQGPDRHDLPFRVVSVEEYWGLDLPKVKAELVRAAALEIESAAEAPSKTQVRKIVSGLLDGFPKPQQSKAPDIRRMRAELQQLRQELSAMAETFAAQRRAAEDEEDDIIGLLLQ